jgi:transcription antitermination factor NusG
MASNNNTLGIWHLLPVHAELPDALPDQFIPELQKQLAAAEAEQAAKEAARALCHRFAANAIVRILTGALSGQVGRVVSSERAVTRVEVEAFNRQIVASVPTGGLKRWRRHDRAAQRFQ